MKKSNLAKYFVTALIMFVTVMIYSVLKHTKDAILIYHMSAEMVSATKLFGVLPSAVILTLVYTRLCDNLTRLNIYYLFNIFFISFFIGYKFYLYPNAENILPDLTYIKVKIPALRYIVSVIEGWIYTIYFIMSELWGNVMIALMFWQFQNQINSIDEAKKLYPLLIFIGETGSVTGACIVMKIYDYLGDTDIWQSLFDFITYFIVAASLFLSVLIWLLSNKIMSKKQINGEKNIKKQAKVSLYSKLKDIINSPIFRWLFVIVICYGVSINLIEGIWSKYKSIAYSRPEQMLYFDSQLTLFRGISSFVITIIAIYFQRKFSWRVNALVAPICFIIIGLIFTLSIFCPNLFSPINIFLQINIVQLIVFVGALQNIFVKATKYEFFEPSKEIAYIKVNEELRTKGKAMIEIIGSRFGHSSASALQWLLLTIFAGSSLIDLAPFLLLVCFVILILWVYGTIRLNREIN